MKSPVAWILVLLLWGYAAVAQEKSIPAPLTPGYYIVVAAYLPGQEDFVQRLTSKLSQGGKQARNGYDPGRKFYYVYIDYQTDFNTAVQKMLQTRKEGVFPKAWVRIMKGQITREKVDLRVEDRKEPTPEATPTTKELVSKKETEAKQTTPAEVTRPNEPAGTATVSSAPPAADTAAVARIPESYKKDSFYHPELLTGQPVFLRLYNPTNRALVEGQVEIVDAERSKLIIKVKGNEFTNLPDPKSKSGKLTMISSTFGFRKEQLEINYKSTAADTLQSFISIEGNNYVILFEMIRLHRGDISTLYNVYFYNDAAVMLPESKYELGQLLAMMNENPKYRIRLHGHTNGRSAGKVITMGDSKNFFELTSDVKRGIGSAKDLSRERAEVIKEWLLANGVTANRMEIKAWGGGRMIHDKNSANARKNVRVEVEIIDE